MLAKIASMNKSLINILEKPVVRYSILTLMALHIILLSWHTEAQLAILDNMMVRLLIALLIAWTACFDPVYSVALATVLILSIQELHRRRATVSMKRSNKVPPANLIGNTTMPSIPADIAMTDKLIFDEINKHSLQKTPEANDGILAEYDYYYDPAYTNLTQNVREQNILRNGSFYVTTDELAAAQNNLAKGGNTGAVTALPNSLNAQGMNTVIPCGYDKEMYPLDSREVA